MKHSSLPSHCEVIQDYPAMAYITPTRNFEDNYVVRHNEKLAVRLKRRIVEFTAGSVFGCAVADGDCPLAAHERATSLGHKVRWFNQNCLVLSARKDPKYYMTMYELGDVIHFEGHDYKLVETYNDNIELELVEA